MVRNNPVDTFRLSQAAYEALEQRCEQPIVTASTTDIQAGYQLGVQRVLKLLREGFRVG